MGFEEFTTAELRAELHRRDEAEKAERWEKIRVELKCPECGGDPRQTETVVVSEHRQAPRDDEGMPILYAPYEMGETFGVDYETTVRCVNGHETSTVETKIFEKPLKGPPILR